MTDHGLATIAVEAHPRADIPSYGVVVECKCLTGWSHGTYDSASEAEYAGREWLELHIAHHNEPDQATINNNAWGAWLASHGYTR